MRHLINTAILLLFVTFPATAQNKNQPKPNVSVETLALYVPGEFKGVQYRLMKPTPAKPTHSSSACTAGAGAARKTSRTCSSGTSIWPTKTSAASTPPSYWRRRPPWRGQTPLRHKPSNLKLPMS